MPPRPATDKAGFDDQFEQAQSSIFRLETLQSYGGSGEDPARDRTVTGGGRGVRLAGLDAHPELADLDPAGNLLRIQAAEPADVPELERQRELVLNRSVSLADYLASRQVVRGR